ASHAPHQTLTVLVHRHHRRDETLALRRWNDDRFPALHHCRDGVGRAKINANDFCHNISSPLMKGRGLIARGGKTPPLQIYCATRTIAGRITRSPSIYPFWTTSITCPLSTS